MLWLEVSSLGYPPSGNRTVVPDNRRRFRCTGIGQHREPGTADNRVVRSIFGFGRGTVRRIPNSQTARSVVGNRWEEVALDILSSRIRDKRSVVALRNRVRSEDSRSDNHFGLGTMVESWVYWDNLFVRPKWDNHLMADLNF